MVRKNVSLGSTLGAVLCSTLLYAQAPATPPRQPAPTPWRFAGTAAVREPGRRGIAVPAGRASRRGPRRPLVRQHHRPDADETGRARGGRAHY